MSEFRKFLREPLPSPLMPSKWFARQIQKLKEKHKKSSTYDLSKIIVDKWYHGLSEDKQERITKMYTKKAQADSSQGYELERVLAGVSLLASEISMPENPEDEIVVGIAWDDSGFTPGAAIVADWTGSENNALQTAFELLEEHELEYHRKHDDGYIEGLEAEWGDDWRNIMTEGWNGRSWKMTAAEFVEAMRGDNTGKELIQKELDNWGDLFGYQWGEMPPEEY